MDAFEVNKIAGAVLAALLVDLRQQDHARHRLSRSTSREKPGWALPITEVAPRRLGQGAGGAVRLRQGRCAAAQGQCRQRPGRFKRCLQLPYARKGGPQRSRARTCGASSAANRARTQASPTRSHEDHKAASGPGKSWPPICTIPKGAIPGNKMAFAGIKDNAELADLLALYAQAVGHPAAPAAVPHAGRRSQIGSARRAKMHQVAAARGPFAARMRNEQGLTWRLLPVHMSWLA